MLPSLVQDAKGETLVGILREHLDETKEHAARLEQVFRAVGAEPSSNFFPPLEKLAEHHDELKSSFVDDVLADVFHAASAMATERLELTFYDALLVLARTLDLGDARALLEQNREEEVRALERLDDAAVRLAAQLVR